MKTFDIASIFILFVAISASIGVFFTIEAVLFKKKDRNSLMYIASKFMQAMSIGLILIPEYSNYPAVIIFHNIFYFLGFGGEIYIITTLKTKRYQWPRRVFFAVAIFGLIYNITNASMHFLVAYRIFVLCIFTFFLYVYLGVFMLVPKDDRKMFSVTGWISLVFCIPWGLRAYYPLMHLSTVSIFNSNIFQTPAYIVNIVFFSILPMLYLFIFKEQDNQKLQVHYRKIVAQNREIISVNGELKELNIAKDNFIEVIGHDLKSPIGHMVQLFQLIEDKYHEMGNEELFNLLKKLKESSARGLNMLENLLDWAHAQTGEISFNPEPVLISDLIKENIELLEKQAETKKIKIITEDLYLGTVSVDKNMISTVVRNLVSNAIKFTEYGGKIEINNKRDDGYIVVSVKDNGIGISSDESARLFHLDYGITSPGTNNEKGTGLGLILSKEYIDKHHGTIWVESKLGEGSVFSFSIPVDSHH